MERGNLGEILSGYLIRIEGPSFHFRQRLPAALVARVLDLVFAEWESEFRVKQPTKTTTNLNAGKPND